jgi:phenylalanyl-tRNA synthetase alpha chain
MSNELRIPGKYFSIARCYRPDVVDATHLTEFNQLEGIVLGEDLNFRELLGLLRDFCVKITRAKKVKFLPGYFPFTEPSVEGFIYDERVGKWIEVAPAGIFRPELTRPLGIEVPVLAWGIGIDRFFSIKHGVDIRELFSYNLDFLREARI